MDNNFIQLVKNSCIEHPARVMDFTDLTQGLFSEVSNGNINVNYHPEFPHLAIFKYSQHCVTERNWNEFTIIARGLILDLQEKKVVGTPFVKFFNYDEIVDARNFTEPDYVVTEKIDGSLGILVWAENDWRIATGGSFISEQAQWANEWIHKNMDLEDIDKTNTYLFEIIYASNKIVVQYDFEGLVLLGIFDSFGLEYSYEQLVAEASYLNTRVAKQYNFADMDGILKNAKELDRSNEGYVIKFLKNGVRLKVKGDEYVRVHRLISRVTPLAIWESILNGDNLEEIKVELPEEMEKDYETIVSIINDRLDSFVKEVEGLYNNTKEMTDKELGLYMRDFPNHFNKGEFPEASRYIFLMRKGKFYDSLSDLEAVSRRKIFNAFKPKANVLDGYVPSSIVGRFVDNI